MKIHDLLKQDHDKVKELLAHLEHRKDLKVFKQLKSELIAHSEAEEEAYYEPLKEKLGNLSIAIEVGHEEHNLTMEMMDQLEIIEDNAEWKSLFSVIKKCVEAHIAMEESDIFHLASKHITADESKKMAEEMQALKEKYKAAEE